MTGIDAATTTATTATTATARAGTAPARAGIAHRLAEAVRPFIGGDLPVRLEAWDGSVAGPAGATPGRAAQPRRPASAAVAPG